MTVTNTPIDWADYEREQPAAARTDGPVHLWFGLSYCNFLVWHRSHMQSMPLEWQQRFVELAEELDAAYRDQPAAPGFDVTAVDWTPVCELTDAQMRVLEIGYSTDETDEDDHQEYYLHDGTAVPPYHEVGLPARDPVPHYNRGRTYLPPDEAAIAAVKRARADKAKDGA